MSPPNPPDLCQAPLPSLLPCPAGLSKSSENIIHQVLLWMTVQLITYLFLRVFLVQMDMDIQEEKEHR